MTAKRSIKAAIATAGKSTSKGSSASKKCKDCHKEGLAIYLALQAIGPKDYVGKLPAPKALLTQALQVTPSAQSQYFVRPLRQGYVYVFKEGAPAAEQWDCYYVSDQARLTLTSVTGLAGAAKAATEAAFFSCSRAEHNGFSPQFITVDPKYSKVWIAFSTSVWTKKVLDDYAADTTVDGIANCRTARMQPLDLDIIKKKGEHENVVLASKEALASNIAGFKAGDIDEAANSRLNHPVPRHDEQAENVAARMALAGKELDHPGIIFSLSDTPGVLSELNWQRQKLLAERVAYQSDPEVAWKKLSAESIDAVRGRIYQRKKAEVIQRQTGQPWSETNNPKMVQSSRELVYRQEFEQRKANGMLPAGAEFRQMGSDRSVGRIWVPTDAKTSAEAKRDYIRIEEQYDENARKAFLKEYDATLEKFDKQLEKREKDWYTWLTEKSIPGRQDLVSIARLDHRETDKQCAGDYVYLTGQCVSTGPLSNDSLPWFKTILGYKLSNQRQILLRSLFGNQRDLISWADEKKNDKIYDVFKTIAGAEDLKASKWMGVAVTSYANGILAGVGAAAMALNKNGGLEKGVRDFLTHTVCAAMKAWDGIEIGLIKVANARIGDLQQGLLQAAFSTFESQILGKTSRAAARLRLPKTIAGKTIDAMLWTVDKAADLENLIDSAKPAGNAAARGAATIETFENSLRKVIKGTGKILPAGATRDIVSKIVKRTDTVLGNSGALMSSGVLYMQWLSAVDNLDKVTKVGGVGQMDALLGLGDALFSIVGAGAEVYQGFQNAKAIAKKIAVGEGVKRGVRIVANGAAGVANLFNSIQSFSASARRWKEDDKDAATLHFGAGAAFFGGAIASFSMAFGAKAVFFGPMLGLGPAGWAVLFTVAAVGLTYAALSAEDTDAEKYLARNHFWSKHKRKEPAYSDWRDEAGAFTALWYGVTIGIDWGDSIISRLDTVTLRATIAEPDPAQGWRYRLWVTFPEGEEVVMVSGADAVPEFPSPYPPRKTQMDETPKATSSLILYGRDFTIEGHVITREDNRIEIRRTVNLNDAKINQARLEFDYFLDAENMSQYSHLEHIEKD